jgi:hypothetical protein
MSNQPFPRLQEGLNSEEKEVVISLIQQRIFALEEEKDYAFEKEDRQTEVQTLLDVLEKLS